jgi:hypothetical protein
MPGVWEACFLPSRLEAGANRQENYLGVTVPTGIQKLAENRMGNFYHFIKKMSRIFFREGEVVKNGSFCAGPSVDRGHGNHGK